MSETPELDPQNIPRHVAIIMDGNGRWAKERRMPRLVGHRAGVKAVKGIVEAARELGISVLTLYAFSTENWRRPPLEVQGLMALLKTYLAGELANMLANNIELRYLGQVARLPDDVRELLFRVNKQTAAPEGSSPKLILNLALSYGSRTEMVEAARSLAAQCARGELEPDDITEELFSAHLYTAGLPDPDLIIRTSGESRLSNFLLWQASYSEIYITPTKWPDFDKASLVEAIRLYQGRERRFGKTGDQLRPRQKR